MKYCATVSEYGRLQHKEFSAESADKAIQYAENKWDTVSVYHWAGDQLITDKWNG